MKIALCVLTYNEFLCSKEILPKIPQPGPDSGFDAIYAIDGGSTDGTIALFAQHKISVIGQSRRGRGDAFHQALKIIDADAFIFFSPDGNEDINDLPKFKKYLETGADLVIASRMMKGALNEEDAHYFKWRKWANNAFNLFANLLFNRSGHFITDSINGYRAITRSAMHSLNLSALDYTIEYQMTIRAMQKRLKIVEFPTIEGARLYGETQARSIPTGLRFLKCIYREALLKFKENIFSYNR